MPRAGRNSFRAGPKARSKPRYSGQLFLIVTEGQKTEPKYLDDLVKRWRLRAEVFGAPSGNSPDSVVDFAIQRMKERAYKAARRGDPEYDQVWCVIDRDRHPKQIIDKALDKAAAHEVLVALSVPSVEVWFLLHFAYTTKQFGDWKAVGKELNRYLPNGKYSKVQLPLDEFFERQQDAIQNAAQLRIHCEKTGAKNPSTQVDLLIMQMRESRPTK